MSTAPSCPYCAGRAVKTTGAQIYPNRPDLGDHTFYVCAPCDARVGCHRGTDVPLGALANRPLREARMQAHKVFDQIWADLMREKGWSKSRDRQHAYAWLATALAIPRQRCHIGMMSVDECARVIEICGQSPSTESNHPMDV